MFETLGSNSWLIFYMSTQNGLHLQICMKRNFDSHLRIKYTTLWSSPYVCIGSHAFAMFAHKKNYGRAGYVDDPLPNIVYMAIWMPACIVWHPAQLCGGFHAIFFCLVCGLLERKKRWQMAISIHSWFRHTSVFPWMFEGLIDKYFGVDHEYKIKVKNHKIYVTLSC